GSICASIACDCVASARGESCTRRSKPTCPVGGATGSAVVDCANAVPPIAKTARTGPIHFKLMLERMTKTASSLYQARRDCNGRGTECQPSSQTVFGHLSATP